MLYAAFFRLEILLIDDMRRINMNNGIYVGEWHLII
jgi:hypothetical protein